MAIIYDTNNERLSNYYNVHISFVKELELPLIIYDPGLEIICMKEDLKTFYIIISLQNVFKTFILNAFI